jgi:hypothetical protein
MARIVLGSYVVQFPLGGYLSWVLQWLVGLQELGHETYFVEKSTYPDSCYDPARGEMSNDCSTGVHALAGLLRPFGLAESWCFVDFDGGYHGVSRERIEEILGSADLFIDMGTHGAWLPEAAGTGLRVLIDGEPAATQMRMQTKLQAGEELPRYDRYYTVGQNIGTAASSVPTAGREWRRIYYPVFSRLFATSAPPQDAPFTTIMSWEAHDPVSYDGKIYGAKSSEFEKFVTLPSLTAAPIEIAVSGKTVPKERLKSAGFRIRSPQDASLSFERYCEYIAQSRGEFSVCKNVFVETNSGWFGDRVGAYLASARPVVMQETGFSAHLPCGEGLFAVRTAEEAASAIDEICGNYVHHSRRARELALEYLDTRPVLGRFLSELGV